jgi:hypothetical protein
MNDYPKDKAELLERIQHEWAALEDTIQGVSDDAMTVPDTGGWSIKDNLAHLAAWLQFLRLHYLGDLPAHQAMRVDETTFAKVDEDGLNAILYQRNRDRPVPEVIAELRRSHAEALADLEQMSFADLMRPRFADDPEARPLIAWVIGNTYEHYREHRAAIERLIERGSPD